MVISAIRRLMLKLTVPRWRATLNILKGAIDDLFNGPESAVNDAIDRHFGATFVQRVNGVWIDRQTFVVGISELRSVVAQVTVTVLDELVDAGRYAERHIIELIKHDGERIVQEVYVFARFDADGRFNRIEETSVAVSDQR
ncbi:hypothetical protein [Pseudomonas petrae]|uniref:hypothetical protein n=1 Tax=Pseudomonas petrae TaxID=2912190 RepID=UPI001EF0B000|nr:hypothetical protein [Pseudomonas petrae]MCF7533031.1 hypothetical protein [Pseudomonas petrae]MCF7554677.1 hypothetical protein [Pseudomonas petrae]